MKRLLIGLVVFAGLWLYNGGFEQLTGGGDTSGMTTDDGDPVTAFSDADQQMNAAMAEAQSTFPVFLKNTTDADGYSVGNVSVKVAFDTNSGPEIIWVGPFAWDGAQAMAGMLRNQPNYMDGLNAGDQVDFSTDMIRDWSFIPEDGTLFGNYTTRVMIPMLDEATATSLAAALSDDPIPAAWQ